VETSEILTFATGIVALIVALIVSVRQGNNISVEAVTETLSDIETAAGAAREWVLAAEQLRKTGVLTKDERYSYVLRRLQDIYPGIDDDTLQGSIEAAVRWMKLLQGSGALSQG
jgi:hypothetical protein